MAKLKTKRTEPRKAVKKPRLTAYQRDLRDSVRVLASGMTGMLDRFDAVVADALEARENSASTATHLRRLMEEKQAMGQLIGALEAKVRLFEGDLARNSAFSKPEDVR